MVTTEVPMKIKDNVILLDSSPEKVSMVFDYILHKKLPPQFDLNEWEAAFDFFCFDAPKFEEHCLYFNNDVRPSYHINPKVPTTFECSKFYDVLLKEDYWKRLLSNFGVILSARFTANHQSYHILNFCWFIMNMNGFAQFQVIISQRLYHQWTSHFLKI